MPVDAGTICHLASRWASKGEGMPRRDATRSAVQGEQRHLRFSLSELRVLRLLAEGRTYQAIAAELYLSPATVAFHVGKLQARLRVPNNAALVAVSLVMGLLTADQWPPQLTGITDIDASLNINIGVQ